MFRSLWKRDRISNFSPAHDFSDSTNDPASIGSWSWAILLATWIGDGSEISSQQLVIVSAIYITTGKHSLEHVLSCVNTFYLLNDVYHIHIPVKHGMSRPCCICVRALDRHWPSCISTHKWRRHTSHCDVMNRHHPSYVFSFYHGHVISILDFPENDLCHDSINNKLFGFVFSRSD